MKSNIYDDILKFVMEYKYVSTALIQRKFRIGYNHAEDILEKLEQNGIVGKKNNNYQRKVIKGKDI